MQPKIAVITSCTGQKKFSPPGQLRLSDFQNFTSLRLRESELKQFRSTAAEMYTGRQHLALMNGLELYRSHGKTIDLFILSAGYGWLKEDEHIVPYEVTFNTMKSSELKKWSNHLQISSRLQELIDPYDLVFFLLGNKYLQAINWPIRVRSDQKFVFFSSESSKSIVQGQPNHYQMISGKAEAKQFRSGLIEIKGFLFAKLLQYLCEYEQATWEQIWNCPELIREFLLEILFLQKQPALPSNNADQTWLPFYKG